MADINDCIPGHRARVLRTGVARVVGKTGTIVDRITLDVPGHGEIVLSPPDLEVLPD
jgi:hypothetical protein